MTRNKKQNPALWIGALALLGGGAFYFYRKRQQQQQLQMRLTSQEWERARQAAARALGNFG